MAAFRPKYLTFDCYGTLIDFQMSHMTRTMFADRLAPERLQAFTTDFSAYRFDEGLGEGKPYADVIKAALRPGCTRRGVPFHAVYTAEQAQAYKPRLQAFEYLIDQLGCDPADLLHVSSSLRYDHMSAYDVGIRHTVYIDRGHGPSTDYYGYPTLQDLGGLPALVGLT